MSAQLVEANSIGALALTGLVTGAVSIVVSLLLARLTLRFVKRPELEQTVRSELDKERQRRALDRAEAVHRTIVATAGPLLVAAEDLVARLDNVLGGVGYPALAPDEVPAPGWSLTHEYFMGSTLYLFGRYFAWVEGLRKRLGSDEYLPQHDKDRLNATIRRVSHELLTFPGPYSRDCPGQDAQVFSWQQVAMGETLLRDADGAVDVSSYADFVARTEEVDVHFEPLRALLLDLSPFPAENCLWQRLTATHEALKGVCAECRRILELDGAAPQ